MLMGVLIVPGTQVTTTTIGGEISDSIEFVVSHHGQSSILLNHGPDHFENTALMGTSIDKIPKINDLTFLVTITCARTPVAKLCQQRL